MPRESEATIQSRTQLRESLDEVATRGYGVPDEESAPGLVAVGVSVRRSDRIVGRLSVGGPKYRIDATRLHDELAAVLLEKAAILERRFHS